MQRFLGIILFSLLTSHVEVKTIEPITCIVGFTAMTIGALRTTTGKVFVGAALSRFTQTSAGKKMVERFQKHFEIHCKKQLTDRVGVQKTLETYRGIKKQAGEALVVQKIKNYIAKKRAELKQTVVYTQKVDHVTQKCSSDSAKTVVASDQKLQDAEKVSFTQNNATYTSALFGIENKGVFSRTVINDPKDFKEYGEAIRSAAASEQKAESEFWKGKYKGLRNGVCGMFGLGSLTYYIMPKKKEPPIVVVIDSSEIDSYYPRGSKSRFL